MEFLPPVTAEGSAQNVAIQSVANLSLGSGVEATGGSFASLVSEGLNKVNRQLVAGQQDLQRLAVGDVQNLHQVMIQLEEARLSFQLMMQVRSRLLESYQDLMKMSI